MDNMREFKPTELEDLPEEVQPIARFALQMREKNAQTIGQIEAMGGGVDIATARLEHVLFSLVELGVIDNMQLWQMQADWEKALRMNLKRIKEQLAGMRQAAEEAARAARFEKKLIIPGRD